MVGLCVFDNADMVGVRIKVAKSHYEKEIKDQIKEGKEKEMKKNFKKREKAESYMNSI